jgi:two-component system, OmpR family, phosphate regulon response regulator PhoB
MTTRILVCDDEPDILDLVQLSLSEAGFAVDTASSGQDAIDKLRRAAPDLAVLDLMLPDMPGTEVCRFIRTRPELADVLVLMLTAKGEEVDRIVGFELGADDYVTKPFSPRELVLRVRALLRRRAGAGGERNLLERDAIRVDLDRHRCFVEGEEIGLTAKEFQLLATLMRKPGRVLTRERLLDEIWGSDVTVTMRTIDTHLKRLREKLGKGGDLIETVRGVGYRFTE